MEGIDFSSIAKQAITAVPFWSILIFIAIHFMKRHQKTSDSIEQSVRDIQISLAAANLPKIQRDLEGIQALVSKHEALLKLNIRFSNGKSYDT